MMFFVGMLVTPRHFARIGRTMGVLAGLSAVYGLIQMGGGPTFVDRAWASETFSYSIHGGKVFVYLEGASQAFRGYSYYADPVTWGFSLLAGLVGAILAREQAKMSRWFWLSLVALVLAGAFCTLTRTVWVGLLVTAGVFVLFRYRAFRRPWLVFCLSMGSFAVVVVAGDFLYRELFLAQRLPLFENALTARYLTVGTIEARISAWSALQDAVSTTPVIGQGYGAMLYALRDAESAGLGWKTISHNFVVDLVRNTGVPGALLFVWFYLQWLREGFAVFRTTLDTRLKRSLLLIIAFSVGSVITGYLNGANFMTYEFFLITGLLTGCATHPRLVVLRREAAFARYGPSAHGAFPPSAVRGRTAV
jgi:O-antigen ligase